VPLSSVDDIRNLIVTQKLNALLESPFAPASYAPTVAGDLQQRSDALLGGRTNSIGKGKYDSVMEVYVEGELAGSFDSRSIPSDQTRFATIQPGFYIAEHHMHQGKYDALQVVNAKVDADAMIVMADDVDGLKDLGSRAIPTMGPNPAHPNQSFASGINIHHAGIDDFTGITSRGTGVTEGCQVIATSEWSKFMGMVGVKANGKYSIPYFNIWIIRR
jgi:hypothetical protein